MSSTKRKRETSSGSVEVILGGDLLKSSTEPFLAHQANCESKGARGLAKFLFKAFPDANVYAKRSTPSTPGSIEERDCDGRVIVALYAQRSPGLARSGEGDDSGPARLAWFEESPELLGSLMVARGADRVALPFNIGCGLAGGKWTDYRAKLDAFAERFDVSVKLYDLERASLGPPARGGKTAGAGGPTGPRKCADCSKTLPANEPAWKVRCYSCWKANK